MPCSNSFTSSVSLDSQVLADWVIVSIVPEPDLVVEQYAIGIPPAEFSGYSSLSNIHATPMLSSLTWDKVTSSFTYTPWLRVNQSVTSGSRWLNVPPRTKGDHWGLNRILSNFVTCHM